MRISDLRGIAQLLTQGTTGVARVVEGVHASVVRTVGLPGGREPGTTRAISGLVYRIVRGVTRGVGAGVDGALALLQKRLDTGDDVPDGPQRAALVSVVNGVLGDHLVASGNPLAIPMGLRYRNQPLFAQPMPNAQRKVLVLIHGLCMNDRQWRATRDEDRVDHGATLAAALGYTPVYLHYNSGRHISQNGRELSAQLEVLCARWPEPLEEIAVVAHSMGGLVIRSACHQAEHEQRLWRRRLEHIVFLGTPHHGAPLERVGNLVDAVLGGTPWSAPFAALGKIRSAGITDLRYGHLLDEDWQDRDRFRRTPDARAIVPLPAGVACHAIAATTAAKRSLLAERLIGDGLVPLRSALGQHDEARRTLGFSRASQSIVHRCGHLALLHHPAVSEQMMRWLTTGAATDGT